MNIQVRKNTLPKVVFKAEFSLLGSLLHSSMGKSQVARTVAYASFQLILTKICLSSIPIPCGVELATVLQMLSIIFSSIKNPSSWGKDAIRMGLA